MKNHTTYAKSRVTLTDLDLTVVPQPGAPTFKVDRVSVEFFRHLGQDKSDSRNCNMYGYRVDEDGNKVGHYTRVRRNGKPRPDEVQALVTAEQAKWDEALGLVLSANSDGEPEPSAAQQAEYSADADTDDDLEDDDED